VDGYATPSVGFDPTFNNDTKTFMFGRFADGFILKGTEKNQRDFGWETSRSVGLETIEKS
jgi:hypothetical protein